MQLRYSVQSGKRVAPILLMLTLPILLVALWAIVANAQRDRRGSGWAFNDREDERAAPKDTEFVFARIRYGSRRGNRGFGGSAGWAHDYPDAEEHILQVGSEATTINTRKMSYVIVDLDSEDIHKYPFAYFSEVGQMNLSIEEADNFREYLDRGGFAMIDDFDSQRSLDWFLAQMQQVFPERDFVPLTIDHPIFHTFYEIPTLALESPYEAQDGGRPTFYGYFDESGRLAMIINHNNDIGDFWEWIDQPRYPLQPSTEALRLGINYLMFALTH